MWSRFQSLKSQAGKLIRDQFPVYVSAHAGQDPLSFCFKLAWVTRQQGLPEDGEGLPEVIIIIGAADKDDSAGMKKDVDVDNNRDSGISEAEYMMITCCRHCSSESPPRNHFCSQATSSHVQVTVKCL